MNKYKNMYKYFKTTAVIITFGLAINLSLMAITPKKYKSSNPYTITTILRLNNRKTI